MIQELHQQIETGEYFEDAKNLYADTYFLLKNQFIAILIVAIASVFGAYYITDSMLEEYSIKKFFFVKYVDDQVQFRSVIKPIGIENQTIDVAVASYLIKYYVRNIESYSGDSISQSSIQEKLSIVENNSSRMVFNQYVDYIDPSRNPNTPIFQYTLDNYRKVEIISVDFPDNMNRPESAKVYFKVIDNIDSVITISYWNASIEFSLNSIANVLDNRAKLNFFITSYQTEQMS